ncbi:MAG: PHP domain-containing protein, partial [Alphaproteobacteria bacterium]|nr:PHP domain-containing protein [Alphaproteobacteria bacterium]
MAHAPFVHLRVHSAYSLSEGALQIADIVKLCRTNAMPAIAVTDTANMFGALEFSSACRKGGVQPIVGTILNVVPEVGGEATVARSLETDRIVLLVQNEVGYRNLSKLSTLSYRNAVNGRLPHVALPNLGPWSEGLIALTGGPGGAVGRLLRDGRAPAAAEMLGVLARIFPKRLYVELQRHGMAEEAQIEEGLIELAYAQELPLVATNDVFFSDANMFQAHDALLCIADGTYVEEADRRRMTPEHRFKSADEMRQLFADLPEAVDNTVVIAQRCSYAAKELAPILPQFPLPDGRNEAEEMSTRARAGLEQRLAAHVYTSAMDEATRQTAATRYREKLAYELDVIAKMGFAGYFLIVADFI